jgi:hypothetical protein
MPLSGTIFSASPEDQQMSTPRLPRLKRADADSIPGRLTPRDIEILKAVYECRVLTTVQIERLFFSSSASGKIHTNCQERLKRLFHWGLLIRDEQGQRLSDGRKPLVYWLDQAGAIELAHRLDCEVEELDWRPGEYKIGSLFLDHLLATNDIRVAITVAARRHTYTLAKWIDERVLRSPEMKDSVMIDGPKGKKQKAAFIPDGFFILDAGEHRYHQFVEADRRTETLETWKEKIQAYLEFYRSGKYQARYQTSRMRVLAVTTVYAKLIGSHPD